MSAVHNIIYQNMEYGISDRILSEIERALVLVAKHTDYSKKVHSEYEFRERIEIRRNGALLAYRLFLYERENRKDDDHSEAVELWKDICVGERSKNEFSEVKNMWFDY